MISNQRPVTQRALSNYSADQVIAWALTQSYIQQYIATRISPIPTLIYYQQIIYMLSSKSGTCVSNYQRTSSVHQLQFKCTKAESFQLKLHIAVGKVTWILKASQTPNIFWTIMVMSANIRPDIHTYGTRQRYPKELNTLHQHSA